MSEPERTPDGRYLVIEGRRWRASDPAIPETLRVELVAELMAARRAVRDAAGEDAATAAARRRVQDAKVALGERGEPWWEPASDEGRRERLSAAVDERVFSRWAMAEVSKLGRADIPLHVAAGQIRTAAEQPVTREQSAVLRTMRNTIGADSL